jgi:hypothetical protein
VLQYLSEYYLDEATRRVQSDSKNARSEVGRGMGHKDSVAHDDTEQGMGSLQIEAGRSDIEILRIGVVVELVAVPEIHSVQEDRFGVASEVVALHGIVALEATWRRHSRFLLLGAPLRWGVRA